MAITDAARRMQIGLILKHLDELRRLDTKLDVFAASDHRYALAPPVDPDLLRLVETTLGSQLPADYRRFLTEIGNGGAGPYYGILSLEQSIIRSAMFLDVENATTSSRLSYEAGAVERSG